MGHGHHIEVKQEQFVFSPKAKRFSMILMILGLIFAGLGIANLGGHEDSHAVKTEATSHEGTHGEGHAAAAAHEEHGNVPNEAFGPRMEFHPLDKPANTRIWANLMIAGYFFLMISLVALMWYATKAIS